MQTLLDKTDVRVMIYRTSIYDENDVRRAEFVLNNHYGIKKWSIDLLDSERVLKIEGYSFCPYHRIEKMIHQLGYKIEELNH
jgi:hypothetical protein